MTEHDMWLATPPEDVGPGRTCGTCAHCIEECCDIGPCERKLMASPMRFDSWREAVGHMETARADMKVDTCARWEEYEEGVL